MSTLAPDNLGWLHTLRRYFVCIAAGNLFWETAHLPLYTLWSTGTPKQLVFAVVHCTAGDLLIAAAALLISLLAVGDARWPAAGFARVASLTISAGVGYTIYSEWLNIVVRKSWAYSAAMPMVPMIDVGLSPLLQWVVVPLLAFRYAKRA